MNHTPGPWHVRGTYNGRSITRTYWIAPEGPEPGTEALAKIMRHNRNRSADALLMAAAPELLEALQRICAKVDAALHGDTGRYAIQTLDSIDEIAQKAIAKAEGRA